MSILLERALELKDIARMDPQELLFRRALRLHEEKFAGARHVRTSEGHAKYGESIGQLIVPDISNLPDMPGGGKFPKLPDPKSIPDVPLDEATQTEVAKGMSKLIKASVSLPDDKRAQFDKIMNKVPTTAPHLLMLVFSMLDQHSKWAGDDPEGILTFWSSLVPWAMSALQILAALVKSDPLERALELKDRVRTAAGVRKYGQALHSVIVADPIERARRGLPELPGARSTGASRRAGGKAPLTRRPSGPVSQNLPKDSALKPLPDEKIGKTKFHVVEKPDGNKLHLAEDPDDGDWVAWDGDDDVAEASTIRLLLGKLDRMFKPKAPAKKTTAKKPAAKRTVAKRATATAAKKKKAPKVEAPLKMGDKYKRVGTRTDVRGENIRDVAKHLGINLNQGKKTTMGMLKPYKGTRQLLEFDDSTDAGRKLRSFLVIPPQYPRFQIGMTRNENDPDSKYDGFIYRAWVPPPRNGPEWQSVATTRWGQLMDEEKFGGAGGTDADGELSNVPELLANRDRIIAELKKATKSTIPKEREAATALLGQALAGFRAGGKTTKISRPVYGAQSFQVRHIKINGDKVSYDFMAKGRHIEPNKDGTAKINPASGDQWWPGKRYKVSVEDKDLAAALRKQMAGKKPSDRVFPDLNPDKHNAYFKEVQLRLGMSGNLHSHNLRHGVATLSAMEVISNKKTPKTFDDFIKARKEVVSKVAAVINDTDDQAFRSYISHDVWVSWVAGHPEWAKFDLPGKKKVR